ncbi:retrovirus-related pol polyprotein from transposon TNT 1-94 [Tanacetum coccineum]
MENATNIVLQGLPPDVYAIVNHHKVAKEIWDRVKLLMQGTKYSLQEKEFQGRQGQSYAGPGYKGNATSFRGNKTRWQIRVVKCYNFQGEGHIARQCTQPKRPTNAAWFKEKAMLAEAQESGQILDEEQLAFLLIQAFQTFKLLRQPFQTLLLSRLRILMLMILTVMMSLIQRRF